MAREEHRPFPWSLALNARLVLQSVTTIVTAGHGSAIAATSPTSRCLAVVLSVVMIMPVFFEQDECNTVTYLTVTGWVSVAPCPASVAMIRHDHCTAYTVSYFTTAVHKVLHSISAFTKQAGRSLKNGQFTGNNTDCLMQAGCRIAHGHLHRWSCQTEICCHGNSKLKPCSGQRGRSMRRGLSR
ncbi:hypothetical protein BaRGS_00014755 [Batillaria attramentaria]|uniref:Uncharacterized protein n=1 Tax=Batillaria attramentaria TaxID=370345 RepID=A0ABD0L3G9_9CAEN